MDLGGIPAENVAVVVDGTNAARRLALEQSE